MQTSPPSQTPHSSSQKKGVVSTRDTNQGGDTSFYYLFSSHSSRAASPSSPPPTSIVHSPLQKLLDAIDTSDLQMPSSTQQQIKESSPQQVIRAGIGIISIPQKEEATPPISKEIHVGISSGSTTTTVETTVLQLDIGYIIKTHLKATTIDTIISKSVGSPQYQEQGALDIKPSITTSGGNSDDLVNSGDGLNYQELTKRVTNLETYVGKIKDMMQIFLKNSKPRPTNAEIAKEIWEHVQPCLHLQKQVAEERYTIQVELVRETMDARYQDTHAEIKAIKDFIFENTRQALTLPEYDDAKKGEIEDVTPHIFVFLF
ncbi:hypothetical protein Hanom_Chr09g00814891 [Helianthus anomalus]